MSFKQLFAVPLLAVTLFLINIFLVLFLFKSFPHFLIANQKYLRSHEQIISYLFYGSDLWIKKFLDPAEYNHIKAVRSVIVSAFVATLVLTTAAAYIFKTSDLKQLKKIAFLSIILVSVSGFSAVFLFEPVFILFHRIFFPQGNWSFPIDSTLIQLYPETFWLITTSIIFVLTLLELVGLYLTITLKAKTPSGGQEQEK